MKTYDGLDVCGLRIYEDVRSLLLAPHNPDCKRHRRRWQHQATQHHRSAPQSWSHYGGYSAGGIFSRVAVGELLRRGYFQRVVPMVSFPHGAPPRRRTSSPPHVHTSASQRMGVLATFTTLSSSGRCRDQVSMPGLLLTPQGSNLSLRTSRSGACRFWLCFQTQVRCQGTLSMTPDSHSMMALKLFKQLICLANTRFGRAVPYSTASVGQILDESERRIERAPCRAPTAAAAGATATPAATTSGRGRISS